MSSSRRTHTKSRNGCGQCKRKRKRCNLVPPQCSNCQRLHLTCSYSTDLTPTLRRLPTSAKSAPKQKFTYVFDYYQHAPAPLNPAPPLTPTFLIQTQQDKMLMHQFVTNTATSSTDLSHRAIYTTILPQLAVKHPFILSTILSFAAQHLAYLSPQPNLKTHYQQLSLKHHNSFCLLFCTKVRTISSNNAEAVILAPVFAVFFQLSLLRESKDDAIEHIIRVFELFRKTARMWESSKELAITRHSLSYTLWKGGRRDESAVIAGHLLRALSRLENLLNVPDVVKDEEEMGMYIGVLGSLRALAEVLVRFPDDWAPVVRWMGNFPEAFLGKLKVGDEFALCVLGVYCGIVMEIPRGWALSGWSERVLHAVMMRVRDYGTGYFDWAGFRVVQCDQSQANSN